MIVSPQLDDFQRPNENPLSDGGNWSGPVGTGSWSWADGTITGQVRINASPATRNQAFGNDASYWVHSFPAGDCEVWGLIQSGFNIGSNEDLGLLMHIQDPTISAIDGYLARGVQTPSGPQVEFWRFDNGVGTSLGGAFGVIPTGGQYLLLRRVGNDLELWIGDGAGNWTMHDSATDSAYTGGYLGIYQGTNDTGFVGFGGGVERQARLQQIIRYR